MPLTYSVAGVYRTERLLCGLLYEDIAMKLEDVRPGLRVQTKNPLDDARRLIIDSQYSIARTPDRAGTVLAPAPGNGSEAWFVRHRNGTIGVYWHHEFERL